MFVSEIIWNFHVEILLHHSVCPVLFHLCCVLAVLALVDQAEVAGEAPLVLPRPHHVAARPDGVFSVNIVQVICDLLALPLLAAAALLEELPDGFPLLLLQTSPPVRPALRGAAAGRSAQPSRLGPARYPHHPGLLCLPLHPRHPSHPRQAWSRRHLPRHRRQQRSFHLLPHSGPALSLGLVRLQRDWLGPGLVLALALALALVLALDLVDRCDTKRGPQLSSGRRCCCLFPLRLRFLRALLWLTALWRRVAPYCRVNQPKNLAFK